MNWRPVKAMTLVMEATAMGEIPAAVIDGLKQKVQQLEYEGLAD